MATASLVDVTAAVEAELDRLRAARPALSSRICRAENILVTHVSCKHQCVIRVRVGADSKQRFLVKGSAGAVYVVSTQNWTCTCPDAQRKHGNKGCKHSLACWVLWRACRRRKMAKPKRVRHDNTFRDVANIDPLNALAEKLVV